MQTPSLAISTRRWGMSGPARTHVAALLGWVGAAACCAAQLDVQTHEPRAFGWHVGDVVSRTLIVEVPQGLELDEASVPQPGARGRAPSRAGSSGRSKARPGC